MSQLNTSHETAKGEAARDPHELRRERERAKESRRNAVVLLCIQLDQSKDVNIRMPMVAFVEVDKDKTTKERRSTN